MSKYVKTVFDCVVFGACLAFTLYQTYQCFRKYQQMPKGVQMEFSTLDEVGKNNFPAITLCNSNSASFAILDGNYKIQEKLKECNITRQVGSRVIFYNKTIGTQLHISFFNLV